MEGFSCSEPQEKLTGILESNPFPCVTGTDWIDRDQHSIEISILAIGYTLPA
jgi:hypothetical protein